MVSANPPAGGKICALGAWKKIMKQNQPTSQMRPGFSGKAENHAVNLCRWASRGIAVCALATHCLNPARAANALAAKEPPTQTLPAQTPAYTPKGWQMERYKAFARQAEMPAITVSNKTTLEVGGTVKTDLNRLAQLSTPDKAALAGQFGVPAGVIGKVAERVATNEPPNAAQFAQAIRTAVIDYRFLQGEWGRYHPPLEGQPVKADALQALQVGDINKAWQLYDALEKPQAPSISLPPPPANLRTVSQ